MTSRWNRNDGFALGGLLALPLLWYFAPLFTDACYFLGDLIGQYDPWWTFAHESLREGRFPLWNPYVFGGTPYQAGDSFPAGDGPAAVDDGKDHGKDDA